MLADKIHISKNKPIKVNGIHIYLLKFNNNKIKKNYNLMQMNSNNMVKKESRTMECNAFLLQ